MKHTHTHTHRGLPTVGVSLRPRSVRCYTHTNNATVTNERKNLSSFSFSTCDVRWDWAPEAWSLKLCLRLKPRNGNLEVTHQLFYEVAVSYSLSVAHCARDRVLSRPSLLPVEKCKGRRNNAFWCGVAYTTSGSKARLQGGSPLHSKQDADVFFVQVVHLHLFSCLLLLFCWQTKYVQQWFIRVQKFSVQFIHALWMG